jgi:hypothetical protein
VNTIFIVEASVNYEGSSPVRAFAEKGDAEEFAEQCREYQKTRPAWPAAAATIAEIEEWSAADKAWEAAHPGGDVGSPDYFDVIEIPFGPVAGVSEGEKGGASDA